jgi:hypothetical protein
MLATVQPVQHWTVLGLVGTVVLIAIALFFAVRAALRVTRRR